ncbi:MAG: hypothetical protein KAI66_07965 [Lentisphaeria bacterium]|nr:hypothetical protein [Lentisphaeria bacterium]
MGMSSGKLLEEVLAILDRGNPPDYYALAGSEPLTRNAKRLGKAVQKRILALRPLEQIKGGEERKAVTRALNALGKAKHVFGDRAEKSEYDQRVRRRLGLPPEETPLVPLRAKIISRSDPPPEPTSQDDSEPETRRLPPPLPATKGGLALQDEPVKLVKPPLATPEKKGASDTWQIATGAIAKWLVFTVIGILCAVFLYAYLIDDDIPVPKSEADSWAVSQEDRQEAKTVVPEGALPADFLAPAGPGAWHLVYLQSEKPKGSTGYAARIFHGLLEWKKEGKSLIAPAGTPGSLATELAGDCEVGWNESGILKIVVGARTLEGRWDESARFVFGTDGPFTASCAWYAERIGDDNTAVKERRRRIGALFNPDCISHFYRNLDKEFGTTVRMGRGRSRRRILTGDWGRVWEAFVEDVCPWPTSREGGSYVVQETYCGEGLGTDRRSVLKLQPKGIVDVIENGRRVSTSAAWRWSRRGLFSTSGPDEAPLFPFGGVAGVLGVMFTDAGGKRVDTGRPAWCLSVHPARKIRIGRRRTVGADPESVKVVAALAALRLDKVPAKTLDGAMWVKLIVANVLPDNRAFSNAAWAALAADPPLRRLFRLTTMSLGAHSQEYRRWFMGRLVTDKTLSRQRVRAFFAGCACLESDPEIRALSRQAFRKLDVKGAEKRIESFSVPLAQPGEVLHERYLSIFGAPSRTVRKGDLAKEALLLAELIMATPAQYPDAGRVFNEILKAFDQESRNRALGRLMAERNSAATRGSRDDQLRLLRVATCMGPNSLDTRVLNHALGSQDDELYDIAFKLLVDVGKIDGNRTAHLVKALMLFDPEKQEDAVAALRRTGSRAGTAAALALYNLGSGCEDDGLAWNAEQAILQIKKNNPIWKRKIEQMYANRKKGAQ